MAESVDAFSLALLGLMTSVIDGFAMLSEIAELFREKTQADYALFAEKIAGKFEELKKIWVKSLDYYLGDIDKSVRENIERKAQILGCIRIIDYITRRTEAPERELCMTKCYEDLRRLL